jgi:hypothetical protein
LFSFQESALPATKKDAVKPDSRMVPEIHDEIHETSNRVYLMKKLQASRDSLLESLRNVRGEPDAYTSLKSIWPFLPDAQKEWNDAQKELTDASGNAEQIHKHTAN